jgi:hypothetical protein
MNHVCTKKQNFRPSSGVAHSPAPLPIQTDRSTSIPESGAGGLLPCAGEAGGRLVEGGLRSRGGRRAGAPRACGGAQAPNGGQPTGDGAAADGGRGAVVASGLASKRHRLQLRPLSSPVLQETGTAARLHAVVLRAVALQQLR